jgi:hypothetical protein
MRQNDVVIRILRMFDLFTSSIRMLLPLSSPNKEI